MTKSHAAQAGEAGHQGADRQAGRHIADSHKPTPEQPAHAANPLEAKARSQHAKILRKPVDAPDHLHPGPDRADSEKSRGAIHHDQQESQPDMYKEFKAL